MDLADAEDGNRYFSGLALGGCDKDIAVQPLIRAVWRLENGGCAEIVLAWIHVLAVGDSAHNFLGTVTQTAIADLNQDAVMGLENVVGVQFRDAIGAKNLPIRAAGENDAAHAGAFETSFENVDNTPQAAGG